MNATAIHADRDSGLHVLPTTKPRKATRHQKRAAKTLGVVAQVRIALRRENRLATVLGGLLGGGVPCASFQLAHHEVDWSRPLWTQVSVWLVGGGLLFSALTVYQWGKLAFASPWKALGFTLLLEGVLTCAATPWLTWGALCYLAAINATATGVRLSAG